MIWESGSEANKSLITCWNSHQRCSVKKGVVKNFATFTGKHLYALVAASEYVESIDGFFEKITDWQEVYFDHIWNIKYFNTKQ